ncbi:hypothetical protein [Candidatus Nitrospira bockiana]
MRRAILPCLLLIFLVDLATPLGVVVPMGYVIPVFIAGLVLRLEWSAGLAALATVLTVAGYLYSAPGPEPTFAGTNRTIACLLIWLALLLAWVFAYLRDEILRFEGKQKGQGPEE